MMNKKLAYYNIIGVILTIITLVNILSPKYRDDFYIPLLWWLITIVPISMFVNTKKTRIKKMSLFLSIYFTLTLFIYLFEPIITIYTSYSSSRVLFVSMIFLAPISLILIFNLVKNNSKTSDMESNRKDNFLKELELIRINISKGRLQDVFKSLINFKSEYHQSIFNDITLLKNSYNNYKRNRNLNLNTFEENNVSNAKIVNALIEIINTIEEDYHQQSAKRS